jgi:hypothetical protein
MRFDAPDSLLFLKRAVQCRARSPRRLITLEAHLAKLSEIRGALRLRLQRRQQRRPIAVGAMGFLGSTGIPKVVITSQRYGSRATASKTLVSCAGLTARAGLTDWDPKSGHN